MLAKTPIQKEIKGFLIDPLALRITPITLPNGTPRDNLNALYAAIDCSLVEIVYLNDRRDGVFVDEEGLLSGPRDFFYIEGNHQPLAGRGVVVGCDKKGDTISPQVVTLEWLRENTAFVKVLAPGAVVIAAPPKLQKKVAKFFA